jgi:hypothetical protein
MKLLLALAAIIIARHAFEGEYVWLAPGQGCCSNRSSREDLRLGLRSYWWKDKVFAVIEGNSFPCLTRVPM